MPRLFRPHHAATRPLLSALLAIVTGMGTAWAQGGPVILAQHPGTEPDRQARVLMSRALHDAAAHGEHPVLLTGSAQLSTDPRRTALFAQVQSESLCGSAGCTTSVYLPDGHGWKLVLDSVSGPVTITPQTHGEMHDLLVDGTDRWIWNGETYTDTQAAASPPSGDAAP